MAAVAGGFVAGVAEAGGAAAPGLAGVGDAAGADAGSTAVPAGLTAAFGMPSRRGQAKSSARPAGAGTASPFTSTRLTSGSLPGGLTGPVPNSDSEPVGWLVSGTTGPATGRGAGPPAFGRAPAAGVCGSSGAGIASGAPRASITRLISRST